MHGGKLRPQALVDIKGIADMQEATYDQNSGLTIGALTTHRTIEEWELVKQKYYALFEGCSQVVLFKLGKGNHWRKYLQRGTFS